MFKMLALLVFGIILAVSGIYLVATFGLPVFTLPNVNWTIVGLVLIVGSAASFGTAFIASRFK
jgi:drug/metabolite transporter (DMT)-like permease